MQRTKLNDDFIEDLQPASSTKLRYLIYDEKVSNLAIRVGPREKTFYYISRFDSKGSTVRRAIGAFPQTSTAEARLVAAEWNGLTKEGVDPAARKREEAIKEAIRLRSTFALVMEDYIAFLPTRERNRATLDEIAMIRANLLHQQRNDWLDRPISEVTDEDVATLVEAIVNRGARSTALKALKTLRTFFNWAMLPQRRKLIGLRYNPIRDLTPRLMGLKRSLRTRVLEYREIRAYLAAAAATPPPYSDCFRALIETGQRIGEVSTMRWSRLDLEMKTWLIPGGTSKVEDDHVVPLSEAMVEMLLRLRQEQSPDHGDFVFSSSNGQFPLTNFSKKKNAFLKEFNASLPPSADSKPPRLWRWHDVRRTVRTHLEPIVGRREVAEAAIGHSKGGMDRVYNHYSYKREVRKAFNVWSDLLRKVETGTLSIQEWEH
ncbi:tyrosine-type recombinase/integrase [Sinorhizobium meliloti]|nr:tyrosine-type recombinase/integrase [Sinorhizobium meliloti]